MKKGFSIKISLPAIRAYEKQKMDRTTTPKVFSSKKDYRRKPKHPLKDEG